MTAPKYIDFFSPIDSPLKEIEAAKVLEVTLTQFRSLVRTRSIVPTVNFSARRDDEFAKPNFFDLIDFQFRNLFLQNGCTESISRETAASCLDEIAFQIDSRIESSRSDAIQFLSDTLSQVQFDFAKSRNSGGNEVSQKPLFDQQLDEVAKSLTDCWNKCLEKLEKSMSDLQEIEYYKFGAPVADIKKVKMH